MTFAWYGHLKNLHDRRWYIAAVASWEIAFSNISCKYRRTESATVNQVSRNSRSPRGDHVIGFRAVRRGAHEGAFEARLSLGWFMFARSRLLHVSVVNAIPKSRADTASDE
jgi:putative drug/metabolite transporter DUF486